MMKIHASILASALVLPALAGCEDEHVARGPRGGHTSPYPVCQAIIDQCHPLDVGEGPIHDCHDLAHAAEGKKSDAECVAQKEHCAETCVARDGGADGG